MSAPESGIVNPKKSKLLLDERERAGFCDDRGSLDQKLQDAEQHPSEMKEIEENMPSMLVPSFPSPSTQTLLKKKPKPAKTSNAKTPATAASSGVATLPPTLLSSSSTPSKLSLRELMAAGRSSEKMNRAQQQAKLETAANMQKEKEERQERERQAALMKDEKEKKRAQQILLELASTQRQLVLSPESRASIRAHLITSNEIMLPNVLSDLVIEYLYDDHPIRTLWEEIEILCQMKDHNCSWKLCDHYVRTNSDKVSAASPLAIDALEAECRLRLNDPNFQLPSDLKALWTLRNGFGGRSQRLFDGRLWPSLSTMRDILFQPHANFDTACVLLSHTSPTSEDCWWWKYDPLKSGIVWMWQHNSEEWDALDVTENGVQTNDNLPPRMVFHSLTHLLECVKSALLHSLVREDSLASPAFTMEAVSYYSQAVVTLARDDLIQLPSSADHLTDKYAQKYADYIRTGAVNEVGLPMERVRHLERNWVVSSMENGHTPQSALAKLAADQKLNEN